MVAVSDDSKFPIKFPNIKDFLTTNYARDHKGYTPPTDLNGNKNWGTGDGFLKSSSDSDIIDGENARNSNDSGVVLAALNGVKPLADSPDNSKVVGDANSQVDQSQGALNGAEGNHASALQGKNKAQKDQGVAEEGQVQASEQVAAAKENVQLKTDALSKAEGEVEAAAAAKGAAEATLSSATAARQSAQQAYDAADEKSKPALLAALNAAKAAEEAAQKQVDLAQAKLEKAQAQKEKAQAEL